MTYYLELGKGYYNLQVTLKLKNILSSDTINLLILAN